MSTYGSNAVGYFLIEGRSVLGTRTDIEVAAEASIKETTPLGVSWPTFAATGTKRGTITQEGWFDDATGSINDALCTREGTSQILLLAHEGNTIGKKAWGFAGTFAGSYIRSLAVEDFHKAKATHVVSGSVEHPIILDTLAAHTADGNTEATPVDNSSSTATGGSAYLEGWATLAVGGYVDLAVTVRHSADNITYADLAAFASINIVTGDATRFAERLVVASGTTINRYLAISWDFTGSGTGPSATFTVAFARL